MTPIEKDIDVLDPTGSRHRFGQYREVAQAEQGEFYSLKEQVLDHLNIGLAAIELERKDIMHEKRNEWLEVESKLKEIVDDITNFKFN